MILTNLPTDILINFFSFLSDKENLQYICASKSFYDAYKENGGVLTKIKLKKHTNRQKFTKNFYRHFQTIKDVYVEDQKDPHYNIINFPKIVKCSSCDLTEPFIPNHGQPCETETLIFRNTENKPTVHFKTDWSLFPNLKRVVLYVNSIDETDLEVLKKLPNIDSISIYTNRAKTLVWDKGIEN